LKTSCAPNLYLALTHYPVNNKHGNIIASAVTNLDLHDISRAAKTYGARAFYVITPLTDQKELVEKIVSHWTHGIGSTYNPARRDALELIRVRDSLEDTLEHIRSQENAIPKTVVTSANSSDRSISFIALREMLQTGDPFLLIFGTGWGLAQEVISGADYILEPLRGNTDYNHLSVRSAASVILDRLLR